MSQYFVQGIDNVTYGPVDEPIFVGMIQASVNELVLVTARQAQLRRAA